MSFQFLFLLATCSNTFTLNIITMSVAPFGLFSPWKAPLSAYDPDPRKFQEVIFYCASRFRAAVIAFSKEPKPWFRYNLKVELVRASP